MLYDCRGLVLETRYNEMISEVLTSSAVTTKLIGFGVQGFGLGFRV